MTGRKRCEADVDLEKLSVALRRLSRKDLLIIVGRALEHVPQSKLEAFLDGNLRLKDFRVTKISASAVFGEVRRFYEASLQGCYYKSFAVNSGNFMEVSEGTEEFEAEFNRLLGLCVHAAGNESRANMREAFELLFDLLRRIDFGDEIVFFADEGGSWAIDVNWHIALPAYFRCLAETASPEDYAREVDRAIKDFSEYHRPGHLAAARRTADAAQKAALRAVRPAQTRPLSGHR